MPKTPKITNEKGESEFFEPKFIPSGGNPGDYQRREAARSVLPAGASLDVVPSRRTAAGTFNTPVYSGSLTGVPGAGFSNTMFSAQRPYMPFLECLIKGTPVSTVNDGLCCIEDIKEGVEVFDRNGEIQIVEKQWCSGIPEELVKISCWGGWEFISTTYHNWPVWAWCRECQCGCGEEVTPGRLYVQDHYKTGMPTKGVYIRGSKLQTAKAHQVIPEEYEPRQKLRADEIHKGDFLMIPRKFNEVETDISEEDARFLGYYISEGNFDYNHGSLYSVELTFGYHERDTWVKDASNILEYKEIPFVVEEREDRGACRIRSRRDYGRKSDIVDTFISWIKDSGGSLAANKSFNSEVMRWPLSLKKELIKGMFRGDATQGWTKSVKNGYKGNSFHITYTTISKTLASQTQIILAQLGYPSACYIHPECIEEKFGKRIKSSERYDIYIPSIYAMKIADFVWGDRSKSENYDRKCNTRSECMVDDDYIYIPIKKISIIKNENQTPVYNLTVSGDHSYLLFGGIATYNSPDRQQIPQQRSQWNAYLRMFHRLDPLFGTAIDMYSEMSGGEFDLIFNDQSSEIKESLEYMVGDIHLLDAYKQIIQEFLVLGEAIPHLFFNDETGLWSYITLHNPDYIEVTDVPFVHSEPIIQFVPSEELRMILSETSPEAQEMRDRLPSEFVQKILARQKIRLSPLNCTFLARKMSQYDLRGTSIGARLWRTWMVEDAVYAATIATFRRAAAPIKALLLGDPQSGTIPSPEREQKLMELLKQCELDPQGWLSWDYLVKCELWGAPERAITINKEYDIIEKMKLSALGLSKSFMSGEVSYSCWLPNAEILTGDFNYKNIEDMEIGEAVIDRFGKKQTVTDVLKYPAPDEMVEISLYGNKKLILTDNHYLPVFCRPRECQCGCGGELWDEKQVTQGHMVWRSFLPGHYKNCDRAGRDREDVEYGGDNYIVAKFPERHDPYQKLQAKDVKRGDWLMIPRKFEIADVPPSKENLVKARILGYYVAEGSWSSVTPHIGSSALRFSFGGEEKEEFYAEDTINCVRFLGYDATISFAKEKYTVGVGTKYSEFNKWVKDNGGRLSKHKQLSEEVMCWDLKLKEELVKGMYRGDGYLAMSKYNTLSVVYTTISPILAKQLEILLAQLGYASYIHRSEEFTDKRNYTHQPSYMIVAMGKQSYNLAKLIWEDVPWVWDKNDMKNYNKDWGQGSGTDTFSDENYIYLPVKDIRYIPVNKEETPYVYSLSVENTHSYVGENIASYNSAKSGLQVFLRRLLSLRQYIENMWIYPKVFKPLAVINGWYRSKPSEVSHQYRVKKTAQEMEEEKRLIIPDIRWRNKLDPQIDADVLTAYMQLKNFGIKISKSTICQVVGLDYNEELDKSMEEFKSEEEKVKQTLGAEKAKEFLQPPQAGGAKPPGGAGAGAMPPGAAGKKPPTGEPGAPGSAAGPGDKGPLDDKIEAPGAGNMPDTIE